MKIATASLTLCALLLAAGLPAAAQYKVVGPDGKVTYTDRPPTGAENKISPLTRDTRPLPADPATGGNANLPSDLRQVATRYPVVLYASAECEPCDLARKLLQGRGIPFNEQRVATEEDAEAMTRLTGGRVVPTLTVGTQALRGLAEGDWHAYLDAAGYPKESRLPRNFAAPAAKPLTERKVAARPAPRRAEAAESAASEPEAATPPPAPAPAPGSIRF